MTVSATACISTRLASRCDCFASASARSASSSAPPPPLPWHAAPAALEPRRRERRLAPPPPPITHPHELLQWHGGEAEGPGGGGGRGVGCVWAAAHALDELDDDVHLTSEGRRDLLSQTALP